MLDTLPHINASLNGLAAVLLIAGYVLIKRRQETAHKWTMMACFVVSVVFLICYLGYHELLRRTTGEHGKPFTNPNPVLRWTYFTILISHIVLAVTVPFLAIATMVLDRLGWSASAATRANTITIVAAAVRSKKIPAILASESRGLAVLMGSFPFSDATESE